MPIFNKRESIIMVATMFIIFAGSFGYQKYLIKTPSENKVEDNAGNNSENKIEKDTKDTKHISEHVYAEKISFKVKDAYLDYDKVINLPKFRNIQDKKVLETIQKIFNFEEVTGYTFTEAKADTIGITAADYEINYDNYNIVSISVFLKFMGAYPYEDIKNYLINLTNGELITPVQIFSQDKITDLVEVLNKKLQEAINDKLVLVKKENPLGKDSECSEETVRDSLQNGKEFNANYGTFTKEDMVNYKITTTGIEFIYPFNFAHVIRACEPNGVLTLNYDQLKSYIKLDGILGGVYGKKSTK